MLLFRSGSRFVRGARLSFVFLVVGSCLAFAGDRKHRKPTPSPSPGTAKDGVDLKEIPLTVGHEAKGLVLPNYDLQGHLLGRFEAGTAARIDDNHIKFTDLKIISFDAKEQPDFNVAMQDAVLNLETRVIDSNKQTKIKRADFEIVGDKVQFNTATRFGTLTGNVHMTIYNQKELSGTGAKP
jgi:hypothetical protein